MERILLGYDASAGSESALDWVVDRALRHDSRVEVILVTNRLLQDPDATQEVLERAEQRLHTQIPALPVETARIDGRMPEALTVAAADADILVIGSDASRPFHEAVHGWLPVRVSATSKVPACVVPAGWSAADGPITLGLAADGSSEAASVFAATEAAAVGESLRVIHAWTSAMTTHEATHAGVTHQRALSQHRDFLAAAVGTIRRSNPDLAVESVLVEDNATSALIIAAADSSLLVLGTHGRGVLAGGFYGSVGQDLIGRVAIPVVVVASGR